MVKSKDTSVYLPYNIDNSGIKIYINITLERKLSSTANFSYFTDFT